MSSPNQINGHYLSPVPHPPPPSSSPAASSSAQRQKVPRRSSSTQHGPAETIVINPTQEQQKFYNHCRRLIDQQLLQQHVAKENSLVPPTPQADVMSLSTTSDGHPSPGTVHSFGGDSSTPCSPNPTMVSGEPTAGRIHTQRGRRKGPLPIKSRPKTAFKRKFKLTCTFHRQKRVSCNCHDFSKLEEGYEAFLAEEANDHDDRPRSRACSASGAERTYGSSGEIGIVVGTGGAAQPTMPSYQDLGDLNELSGPSWPATHVPASMQPILRFNIDSEDSVNEMVSAGLEQPYFPGTSRAVAPFQPAGLGIGGGEVVERETTSRQNPVPKPNTQTESCLLAIGRQMKNLRNRWQCEFQDALGQDTTVPTSTSLTSASTSTPLGEGGSCSWTGPFHQLSDHFATSHHLFKEADEPRWSICGHCYAISPGWDEFECIAQGRCAAVYSQNWFYGVVDRDVPVKTEKSQTNVKVEDEGEDMGGGGLWANGKWGGSQFSSSNLATDNNYSLSGSVYNEYSGLHLLLGNTALGRQDSFERLLSLNCSEYDSEGDASQSNFERDLEFMTPGSSVSRCMSTACGYTKEAGLALNPVIIRLAARRPSQLWRIALYLLAPWSVFVFLDTDVRCRLWCLLGIILLGVCLSLYDLRARDLARIETA
ncbi:hypothetical protein F5Y16DRAFT_206555 [Xylariaceae sp. FL0255]|nr:hypothetical protein F5Y16DRAFT_206555 [Xylariaceae sp. FL0255]